MGIYDRDYLRSGNRGAGSRGAVLGAWTGTTWIIVFLAVTFIADVLAARLSHDAARGIAAAGPIETWASFSLHSAVYRMQVWRLLTFPFVHESVGQLAVNVLILFFFAPAVEGQLGTRRFMALYLLCGMSASILYVLLWAAGIIITSAALPLVGATAGALGILAAATEHTPDFDVPVVYIPFPVKLRGIVWVVLIGGIILLLRGGFRPSANAAHLAGAACGFLLTFNPGLLDWIEPRRR